MSSSGADDFCPPVQAHYVYHPSSLDELVNKEWEYSNERTNERTHTHTHLGEVRPTTRVLPSGQDSPVLHTLDVDPTTARTGKKTNTYFCSSKRSASLRYICVCGVVVVWFVCHLLQLRPITLPVANLQWKCLQKPDWKSGRLPRFS